VWVADWLSSLVLTAFFFAVLAFVCRAACAGQITF